MWYYNGSELEDGTDLGVLFYRENSEGLLFVCPSSKFYISEGCLVWVNKTDCIKTSLKVKFRIINEFGVCRFYDYESFLTLLQSGKLKVGLSPKFAGNMVNELEAFLDSNFELAGYWYLFDGVHALRISTRAINETGYSSVEFVDDFNCTDKKKVVIRCKYSRDEFLKRFAKFQLGCTLKHTDIQLVD